MQINNLVESILHNTDRLWAEIHIVRHLESSDDDVAEAIECYNTLKSSLAKYYELHTQELFDESYLWFISQVITAFEDIYGRFIVNS